MNRDSAAGLFCKVPPEQFVPRQEQPQVSNLVLSLRHCCEWCKGEGDELGGEGCQDSALLAQLRVVGGAERSGTDCPEVVQLLSLV